MPEKVLKNTYVIKIKDISKLFINDNEEFIKFLITKENGKHKNHGVMIYKEFPKPNASRMISYFAEAKKSMGEEMAQTVISYLDKETHEEVLMLFPDNTIKEIVEKSGLRLNRASIEDFRKEVIKRQEIAEKINGLFTKNNKMIMNILNKKINTK